MLKKEGEGEKKRGGGGGVPSELRVLLRVVFLQTFFFSPEKKLEDVYTHMV